jgi:hypothetical protein
MKVAVLIQGDPRFCKEFDLFLENLVGYDQIDWFFYLWEKSPPTANLVGGSGHHIVAPSWQHITKEWAYNKIQNFLPDGHYIAGLALDDQDRLTFKEVNDNFAKETIQSNVWKMWFSQYKVNELKTRYEKENGFTYDLVIRSRPDVALIDTLDLEIVKCHLDNRPNMILMPENKNCGYGIRVCDLFGIGSSQNMNVYCNIYNQALTHHAKGVIFHPETLLGVHLLKNNLYFRYGNFKIDFRFLGYWKNIKTEEIYYSDEIPRWEDAVYHSNFGRWA